MGDVPGVEIQLGINRRVAVIDGIGVLGIEENVVAVNVDD
jgi:hypothetical protein